jgi:uncharacterized phage infection (PIP) family protein YhgE
MSDTKLRPAMLAKDPINAEEADVGRIRDIIFGNQMRDYERRFGDLFSQLEAETNRIKTDVERRLDKFEAFIRTEFEQLNSGISKERTDRVESVEQVERSIVSNQKSAGDKLSRLDEQFTKSSAEIRKLMHDQITELSLLASKLHEESGSRLKSESERLRQDKVGRADLAELLNEVALRLNTDQKIDLGSAAPAAANK